MDRIQDLWIDCPYGNFVDMLSSKLTANAPSLRSLHLSYEEGDSPFTLTKDMFSGAMPGLQRVHLKLCYVNQSSPIFNGLTELSLCGILDDSGDTFWDSLLVILEQLPRLRLLSLADVLPTADDISSIDPEDMDEPISLPQLEKLTLLDSTPSMSAFLAQLKFPRSTVVQIQCLADDRGAVSGLLPLVVDNFSSHPSLLQSATSAHIVFQYLEFRRDGCSWEVEYGTSSRPNAHGIDIASFLEKDMGSRVMLDHMCDELLDSHEILQWFRVFPLAHLDVITLVCQRNDFDDEHLWEEVFRDTSELHVILMRLGYIKNLIHALHPCDGVVPVPTWTDIGFTGIRFERGECLGGRNHSWGKPGCLVDLYRALASRAEAGNVLQRLIFDDCSGITMEDVMELSRVVGRVEWR